MAEVAIDTQVGELATARTFASWCGDQGGWRAIRFDGSRSSVRARGKAQLRIDEARRFVETALSEGDERGLAAAIALLVRAPPSEITNRVVHDVDDAARVLGIGRAKTRAGDRCLEVPEMLRSRLVALVGDRPQHTAVRLPRSPLGRLPRPSAVPAGKGPGGLPARPPRHPVLHLRPRGPVEHVTAALGQTGPAVIRRHCLATGAEQDGKQRAALRVITGGRW